MFIFQDDLNPDFSPLLTIGLDIADLAWHRVTEQFLDPFRFTLHHDN